jgi:hypothetical protein
VRHLITTVDMIGVFTQQICEEQPGMASTIEDRIKSAEERLKKLKVKQARAKARVRTAQSRTARREDTRRKILVGAVVLSRVEQGLLEVSQLREWLMPALEKEEDRALFDLP